MEKKMFPIHKYLKSGINKEIAYIFKGRHICCSLNTHRPGNASCRLHGLEMRNMIHFLSVVDDRAETQTPVQKYCSEARS